MPATSRVDRAWVTLLSHELGGPIAVLRGYSALWIDGSLGDEPSGIVELGRRTWPGTGYLAAGLADLLEAGRSLTEPPDVAVTRAVTNFESIARPVIDDLLVAVDPWLRDHERRTPGRGRQSVEAYRAKILMLSALVDQLSLAVGLGRRSATDRQVIDVRRWLRDLAHQVAGSITASGHRLQVETDAEPANALVTPGLLQAAVLNLLDNAQKFSPAGAPIVVSATGRGPSVLVRVSDRGPGLPEGLVPALFARVDHPAAFDYPGLGLGLAIAANVAHVNGGELQHARRWGGGSVLTIVLPRLA